MLAVILILTRYFGFHTQSDVVSLKRYYRFVALPHTVFTLSFHPVLSIVYKVRFITQSTYYSTFLYSHLVT